MPAIRLTVSAALDASATRVFDSLIAASARARAKIAADGKAAAREFTGGYRDAPKKAEEAYASVAVAAEKSAQSQIAAIKKIRDEEQRLADQRFRRGNREKEQVISGAARSFGGAVRKGVGVAGDVARGAGVNFDVAGYVSKNVEAETKAINIINQTRMAGQAAPEGGVKGLINFARETGGKSALGTNEALDALAEFQAKSSDLKTGQAVLGDLANLARAAGAEFKDVASGAAFINARLDDTPDRAEKLLAIMRAITAQTAEGQVELKDWAKYMPRIAAGANVFSGDYSKNIGTLSALAQIAVAGGRSNAAEASGSAAAFGRDLMKQRTMKAFTGEGLDVFTDKSRKQLKPPEQIIFEALEKTQGDKARLAKLFPNAISAAPVMAIADVFNKAGGGKTGMDAAKKELGRFDKSFSKSDVNSMAAASMDTTAAKAQMFNNQLEKVVGEMADKVIPALVRLAPEALKVAEALGQLAGWVAENPLKAATVALGASVAKEVAGIGLKSMFQTAIGQSGSLGGVLGMALTGAAITIVATEVIMQQKEKAAADVDRVATEAINAAADAKAQADKTGSISTEQKRVLEEKRDQLLGAQRAAAERVDEQNNSVIGPYGNKLFAGFGGAGGYGAGGVLSGIANYVSAGSIGTSFQAQDAAQAVAENPEAIRDGLARVEQQLARLNSGITVKNLPQGGLPGPSGGATTGPVPVR